MLSLYQRHIKLVITQNKRTSLILIHGGSCRNAKRLIHEFWRKVEVASYLQPFRTINWHFQDQGPEKQRIYSNCSETEATKNLRNSPGVKDHLKGPLPREQHLPLAESTSTQRPSPCNYRTIKRGRTTKILPLQQPDILPDESTQWKKAAPSRTMPCQVARQPSEEASAVKMPSASWEPVAVRHPSQPI